MSGRSLGNLSAVSTGPGSVASSARSRRCDLWFPPPELPLGFGHTRKPSQLPVLTMVTGYSRWLSVALGRWCIAGCGSR
jgi:hypothetical protein